MIVTRNFKIVPSLTSEAEKSAFIKEAKDKDRDVQYDKRNAIYCIDPTYDIQCYYNYISTLNLLSTKWISYGYLDMGLVPLFIWPSFMMQMMAGTAEDISKAIKMNLYTMSPTSFLNDKYKRDIYEDIWVKRNELAQFLHCSEDEACLTKLLEIMIQQEG